MASYLLGGEYASSSSSSEEESSPRARPDTKRPAPIPAASSTQLLPSADELFASDTSSVLTANRSTPPAPSHKRKNKQSSGPSTKAVKTETGEAARKPKIAPFAPPTAPSAQHFDGRQELVEYRQDAGDAEES